MGKKEETRQGGLHHRKVQFKNARHYVLADDAYIPSEKDQLQASGDIVTNLAFRSICLLSAGTPMLFSQAIPAFIPGP